MFRDATFKSQAAANNVGFLAPVMENHDEPRGISYYIPKEWENEHGAKAFGTFLMMLRGIPFIYQGQELGLKTLLLILLMKLMIWQLTICTRPVLKMVLKKTEL